MASIQVVSRDGRWTLEPGRTVSIGRAVDCDIHLDNPVVSRRHATLEERGGVWVLEDDGSKRGLHRDGVRITSLRLNAPTRVWFGSADEDGEAVDFIPVEETAEPPAPDPQPAAKPKRRVAPEKVVLRVRGGGAEYEFDQRRPLTVGRDPSCDVRIDDALVSRVHARLSPDGDGWRFVDSDSKRGSFLRGRRVSDVVVKLPTTILLGEPTGGAALVVAPVLDAALTARETKRADLRQRLRVPVVVVGALLVVLLATLLTRSTSSGGGGSSAMSPGTLQRLKQSTVFITVSAALANGESTSFSGSGSILSSDGLILTNAHVAAPAAPGQGVLYGPVEEQNPDYVTISLVRADDKPAEPAYRARVLAADGYLDFAVLKIFATADGRRLREPPRLTPVKVGDSRKLELGASVTVLGFPSLAATTSVNVTRGVAGSFIPDERIGDARSFLNVDARISSGNSGGLAADNKGRLIGVPTQTFREPDSTIVAGRVRPVHLAQPLLDAARAGREYESPYVVLGSGQEQFGAIGWTSARSLGCEVATVGNYKADTRVINAVYRLSQMEAGLDVQTRLFYLGPDGVELLDGEKGRWSEASGTDDCLSFSYREDAPLAPGRYRLEVNGGPLMRPFGALETTVG